MSDLKSLGYVKVAATDMPRWRQFAFDVLGFAKGSGPDESALYLRMDERAARIIVVPGDTDKIVTVGWEVRDHAALERVKAALDAAGVPVKQLSQAEADARRVEEVIAFDDPAGTAIEVFHGAVLDHSPVVTPFGAKFVTGRAGSGSRGAAGARRPRALSSSTPKYWDSSPAARSGFRRRRSSARSASGSSASTSVTTAWRSVPAMTLRDPGLIHLMVEVDSLDAVGQALDRVNKDGFQLSSTLGRHTNDKMVSFYVRAPGDWDIEFGTEGMRVDETYYTAEEITADSYWGHEWVSDLPAAMRP